MTTGKLTPLSVRKRGFKRPGRTRRNDARRILHAEKCREGLELRKAGASYSQIADQLGYKNESGAWKAVQQAIDCIIREPAKDVLIIELARLDTMLLALWAKAKSGDTHAIGRCLSIMERRSAYLGIDAPKKTAAEFDGSITVTDGAHEELLARIAGLTAASATGEGDPKP